MKIDDRVIINKCDECPAIVGKVAKVVGIAPNRIMLNFGRGRPQKNRPVFFPIEDVSIDRSRDVTNWEGK